MLSVLSRNRSLLWELIKREIASRYKGSYGGLYWYIIQNLLLLTLYNLVFGTLFKSRWADTGVGQGNFTIALFVGLIMFNIFAECVTRAPTLVINNANYVKKVVFPLQILPIVQLGAALFNAGVATLVLLGMALLLKSPITWEALWFPVVVAPLAVLVLGLSWIMAAVGTYVRDVNQVVTLLVSATMFLSPLFYPISALPAKVHSYIKFNPLTVPMQQAREVLMFGYMPDFEVLGIYMCIAVAVALFGYWLFEKSRAGFADVL
ncbi:ABC transporter permease [Lysobacter sp. 1R34A]|uniref:ABC transporter permease n=1 Tax=Lysobacter sp. 1R34A TaxID=3445786 RepID=UPI003EEEA8A6